MKSTRFFLAILLIGLTNAFGLELSNNFDDFNNTKRFKNVQSIVFVEAGIAFFIYPDGSFDFKSQSTSNFNTRRSALNTSYTSSKLQPYYTSHFGNIEIFRDRKGKIRSIGDVFLNYDRYGKIKQVGSVIMNYDSGKRAVLKQVGGLHVEYNRFGEIIHTHGIVKASKTRLGTCKSHACKIKHYHNFKDRNPHRYFENDYDKNHYYYKKQKSLNRNR